LALLDGWKSLENRLLVPSTAANQWFALNPQEKILLGAVNTDHLCLVLRVACHTLMIVGAVTGAKTGAMWPVLSAMEAAHFMRITVISVKYGFMTHEENRRVRIAPFAEVRAMMSGMQLLSTYSIPSLALYEAEVERICFQLRPYGIDTTRATFTMQPEAIARLRARVAFDVERLQLQPGLVEPMTAAFKRSEVPISSLAVLVRLAAHPASDATARLLESNTILRLAILAAVFFVLLPFVSVEYRPTPLYPRGRMLLLLPYCGCDVAVDPACGCEQLDWLTAAFLVAVFYPLSVHIYVRAASLEPYPHPTLALSAAALLRDCREGYQIGTRAPSFAPALHRTDQASSLPGGAAPESRRNPA
jgi:hypothetical protein